MDWIAAGVAIAGVILNARGKWQGFICWLISNGYWCWHNTIIDEYAQAILFAIFAMVSIYGLRRWRKVPPRAYLQNRLQAAGIVIEHLQTDLKNIKQDYHLIKKPEHRITAKDITRAGGFAVAKEKAEQSNETTTDGKS